MKVNNLIVIFSNYGLNSDGGGVKVYTKNLVRALQNMNINVLMFTREGIPTEIETKLSWNKFLYILKGIKWLHKFNPKLILSQGGWFTAIPPMIYKSRHPETRIIYLYHTYYNPPETIFQELARVIERIIMTYILSKFDIVLFVSRGLHQNVNEVGTLRAPYNWGILYGAPSVTYPSETELLEFKTKFRLEDYNFYLLGHGLTASKVKARGAKLLISTLRNLPQKVYLILTRKGRFIDELKAFARAQRVENKIIFTGDLENPHIATELSDIYTHISWGEGLPLALLEVMAVGKPIVASNVGGIPEAIRCPLEGVLVDNNIDQLSEIINYLIENPKLRKKMSIISKRAVNKRFSWAITADRLLKFFSQNDP